MKKSYNYNFILLFYIINIFFLFSLSLREFEITFLLFLFITIICFGLNKHFQYKTSIGVSSFFIFNYLFFYVAPIIQLDLLYNQNYILINTIPYKKNLIIKSLVYINFFTLIFLITYYRFQNKKILINKNNNFFDYYRFKKVSFFFLIISICLIPSLFYFQNNDDLVNNLPVYMFYKKFIFFIPFFSALFFSKFRNKNTLIILVLALILLILYKNPFFEKRNALGPIYLTLATIFFPFLFNTNKKIFLILLFSLLVLFPLLTIITHTKEIRDIYGFQYVVNQIDLKFVLYESFNKLHYDAFANLIASIEYINSFGVSFGKQLFGSILFFLPRSFWLDKPLPSGMEIGNYLIDYHEMWFNNISLPLVAEGLLDFGIVGIILFSFLLARILIFFERWIEEDIFLKKIIGIYFSYHMIYILRGDLMTAVAYFAGPFLAIYVLPNFIKFFFKKRN